MRLLAAAGLVGACLATTPLFAADLFDSAPPPMAAPQTELGSNWYIRGDVGYGDISQASVNPGQVFPNKFDAGYFNSAGTYQPFAASDQGAVFNDAPTGDPANPLAVTRGNAQTTTGAIFDAGFGYRINDWLRVEATYNFFRGPGYGASTTVICPEVATAVTQTTETLAPGATTPTTVTSSPGYLYDPTTCDGRVNVTQYNNLGLASGYIDLGHWWGGITPYIGAGVGLNVNTMTGSVTYVTTTNGQPYPGPQTSGTASTPAYVVPSGTDAYGNTQYSEVTSRTGHISNIPIGPQNWNRTINQTKYTIAGQLSAGVGVPISQSATLDIGYRVTSTDITGGVKGLMQSVNVGVRYNLN